MLTVEIREHGKRIASYPTGKLGAAQSQWLQDTGAQLVSVDTLRIDVGLLSMCVRQDGASRRIEIVRMVG